MRTAPLLVALAGLAAHAPAARAQTALATIEEFTVGTSSNPRALQGVAAANLPGLGNTFVLSTGSCVPFVGTGNGLARYNDAWSLQSEMDYAAEPCHFGDITIGSDGTIYAPASEFDGIGFTNDQPFQISRFNASTLAALPSWNADALYATYDWDDLSGADYYHGDLYVVDYRDSSPDDTNLYVFDLATDPPVVIDVFSIASRKVNGVEIYGNRMFIARDINNTTAALDVYNLDSISAGVNAPIETYTYDVSAGGATATGQHSEGLNFNWTPSGPELWVCAVVGKVIRRIALPNAPEYVTWTGAGSVTDEQFFNWSDYFFGWDGQPTSDTNAEIDLVTAGIVYVDVPAMCADLLLSASVPVAIAHLRLEPAGSLTSESASILGASVHINDSTWNNSAPAFFDDSSELFGRGALTGDLEMAGALWAEAGQTLSIGALTLQSTADVRTFFVGGVPGRCSTTTTATLGGGLTVNAPDVPVSCARQTLIDASAISGVFASETLPAPPIGFVNRIVYTSTTVDYVVTRPSDFNSDLITDGADLAQLLSGWGQPGETDLSGDNTTNGEDLAALLAAWGGCM